MKEPEEYGFFIGLTNGILLSIPLWTAVIGLTYFLLKIN